MHCKSEQEAKYILEAISKRLEKCKLELHPEKTKIVYCKDENRKDSYKNERFDFLGYTFRPREAKNKEGKYFVGFAPAISDKAKKKISATIRSWRINLRSDKSLEDIAKMINSEVQGWINYYGKFYKSAMYPVLRYIELFLILWVQRMFKRFRGHKTRTKYWLGQIARQEPKLFAHWRLRS